jgi:hypothetical protein
MKMGLSFEKPGLEYLKKTSPDTVAAAEEVVKAVNRIMLIYVEKSNRGRINISENKESFDAFLNEAAKEAMSIAIKYNALDARRVTIVFVSNLYQEIVKLNVDEATRTLVALSGFLVGELIPELSKSGNLKLDSNGNGTTTALASAFNAVYKETMNGTRK